MCLRVNGLYLNGSERIALTRFFLFLSEYQGAGLCDNWIFLGLIEIF